MDPHRASRGRTAGVAAALLTLTTLIAGCAPAAAPSSSTPAAPAGTVAPSVASTPAPSTGPAASTGPVQSIAAGASPTAGSTSGSTDALVAKYLAAVRADPTNVESAVLLGYSYLQRVRETGDPADYGRADAILEQALALDPKSVDALVGKGTLLLARHQFHDALSVGQQAQTLAPKLARVYGVIADAQTELGMYDDAVASLQTMVDLRPDLASYSRISYARELRGQLDAAIEVMRRAFDAGGAGENREYVRVLLGNLSFIKGDLGRAEKIYTASLEALPGYVYARAGLGSVRAAQGRLDEAIALYQQAADTIPLPQFVVALAEAQEAAGRTDEAAGNYALVRQIEALLAANGVRNDLELALFEANHGTDPARAVELARAAYADQPNIKAADALGWALFKAGNLDEADRYATESLKLGTKDATYLYHAGMIAKARGDAAKARERLSAALALNPQFSPLYAPMARAALAELS